MAVFETNRGGRLDIQLPPSPWPELKKVAEQYEKLARERRVTGTRLGGLEGERTRAIEQDRIALAKAIKDGKDDPGSKRVEKIEKEIAACKRRLEALEEALDMASGDLIATVDEHREEWSEEAQSELEAVQSVYAEAVEALASAREEVSAQYALFRWVRMFPDEPTYRIRGSFLTTLRAQHGDPYFFSQVVDSLREDAQVKYDPKPSDLRDPHGAASQQQHEQRQANEQAGLGYWTDSELERMEENRAEFFGGAGARLKRMPVPSNDND
jgi:hypothetical protein